MGDEFYYPIIILIGASHSGKTHYAQQKLAEDKRTIRVNKDDFRVMCSLGIYDPLTEQIIKNAQFDIIRIALRANYQVIVDNTHLRQNDLFEYASLFNGSCGVLLFDSSSCIERAKITGRIPLEVVEKQVAQFEENFPKEKFQRGTITSIYNILYPEDKK